MLFIVAPEYSYVSNLLEKYNYEKVIKHNTNIYICNYNNHKFLIALTGYGKVNIANVLRLVCDNYNVKVILIMGTAGATSDCNDIFNAIVFNSSLQYDVDFSPIGYYPSVIPQMDKGVFFVNNDLKKCMERACKKIDILYTSDLIASGDMFVCNNNLANSIRIEYNAGVVDNESGVVGQFCYQNNIPFVGVKVISNFAFNNAVKQYNLYDDEANFLSQKIVSKFIKEYYN